MRFDKGPSKQPLRVKRVFITNLAILLSLLVGGAVLFGLLRLFTISSRADAGFETISLIGAFIFLGPLLLFALIGIVKLLDWRNATGARLVQAKASESDWGRRFGWFIEKNGERIAELEYVRWDEHSQFWHQYRVNWLSPQNVVVGPERWVEAGFILRNRFFTDVVVNSYLASSGQPEELVSVRGASVPEERFNPLH